MPDCLSCLVETIVWSLPVKDPHAKQRQQGWIVDFPPIDHMKPFGPVDHMSPQPIVKEEIWEDIIPPAMVCSHLVLPLFVDPMEGILGNLEILLSVSPSRNEEGNYLMCRQVMSPPRHWGMNPVIKMFDPPKKPTCGQLDGQSSLILAKDSRLDDGMLG